MSAGFVFNFFAEKNYLFLLFIFDPGLNVANQLISRDHYRSFHLVQEETTLETVQNNLIHNRTTTYGSTDWDLNSVESQLHSGF